MRRLNSQFPNLIGASEIEIYKLSKEQRIKDIEPELRFRLIHNALIDVYELFGVMPDNWPSDNIAKMYNNSIVQRFANLTIADLTMCIECVLQGKVNIEIKAFGKFDFDLYAKVMDAYLLYRGQVVTKVSQYDNLKAKYQALKTKYANEREQNRAAYVSEIEAIFNSVALGIPIKVIAGTPDIHFAEAILKHCQIQRPDYQELLNNAKEIAKEQFAKLLKEAKYTRPASEVFYMNEQSAIYKACQLVHIKVLSDWMSDAIEAGHDLNEIKGFIFKDGYPNEKELYDRFKLEPIYIAYQAIK